MSFGVRDNQRGESLVEVILAIAILAIGGFAVIDLTFQAFRAARVGAEHFAAAAYATEGWEAIVSMKDAAWNNLVPGTYGLSDAGGTWTLAGASDTDGIYTRTVTVDQVERDGTDNIVGSGTNDVLTRKVTSTVTWTIDPGRTGSVTQTHYLTNWNSQPWFEDVTSDFSDGTFTNTSGYTTPDADGAVGLASAASYWACGELEGGIDATGNTRGNDVYAVGSYAYYVTNSIAAGPEFYIQDISDTANPVTVGSVEIGANVFSVAVDGNYAYLATADNARELIIIDVSTPSAPAIVGSLDLTGSQDAYDVAVSGSRAYLVRSNIGSGAEFYTINVGTPTAPVLLGSVDLGASARQVRISGSHAYVITDNTAQEFRVVDISADAAPTVVASVNLAAAAATTNGLSLFGTHAYVVTANDATAPEFYAIDITTPTSPTVSGSVELGHDADDVTMDGTIAFVGTATANQTVQVVDASNPSAPVLATTWNVGDAGVNGVYWNGSRLFVASTDTGLDFRIYKPNTTGTWNCMEVQSRIDIAGSSADANGIDVLGNNLYGVKNNSTGSDFFLYDVTDSTNPTLTGSVDLAANGNDVAASGTVAYVASASNTQELQVVDVSTPSAPVIAGSYNAAGSVDASGVAVNGTKLLLVQGATLYELNISTPSAPTLLGSVTLPGTGDRVKILNSTYAYVSTNAASAEVQVVNYSTSTPTLVGTYNAPGSLTGQGLWIKGTQLFLTTLNNAGGAELFVVSIASPTAPTLLGSLDLGANSEAVAASDTEGFAFVGADFASGSLRVIDTSTPASPVRTDLSDRLNGTVMDAVFANNMLYVASTDNTAEFAIYGKPTGGGGGGYHSSGTYESSVFDAGSTANWNAIAWTEDTTGCASGTVELQVKTSATLAGLATELWQGPDGKDADETDFFTDPAGELIHLSHDGDQYAQYRATFASDGTCTPQLTDVTLNYTAY